MKWDDVVKKALNMYYRRTDYAYFYGAKGQVLTDTVMDALVKAEPAHFARYSEPQLREIYDYSRGKIGMDCSGFITVLTGLQGSSTTQYNSCAKKWNETYSNPAGSILHKSGHIGLDIGYGYFLHIPIEGRTIELGWSREYNWTESGLIKNVDYEGADAR